MELTQVQWQVVRELLPASARRADGRGRLFARLHNFRRLVVRWERHPQNFLGFIQLGCILILLRQYL